MKQIVFFLLLFFSFQTIVGQEIELNSPVVATAGNNNKMNEKISPVNIAKWRIGEIYAVTLPEANEILLKENQLKVFPNPFRNEVNLELKTEVSGVYTLLITDLAGRQQFYNKEKTIIAGQNLKLDLSYLSPAMYVLTLRQPENDTQWMVKIQKQ